MMNELFKKVGNGETLTLTKEEYLQKKCDWYNDESGQLNEEDGYNCPKCLNKGDFNKVENGVIISVDCECKKIRKVLRRLKNCGVSQIMLDHYTFGNYKTDTEWNKNAKDTILKWCKDVMEEPYWFYISGITGSGKTHLCVAAFQKTIKSGKFTADYMNWNEEIVRLISMSKSYDTEDYDKRLKRLQEVDLLYIDDFLKLTNLAYSNDSISMAFRILDARYRNNKSTIISSEISLEKVFKLDSAVAGRINEKTNFGQYVVDLGTDEDRNYRFGSH